MTKQEIVIADINTTKITVSDLRRVLWKELEELTNGRSTIHRSNAVAKLAAQILDSVRLEVQNKWTNLVQLKSTIPVLDVGKNQDNAEG